MTPVCYPSRPMPGSALVLTAATDLATSTTSELFSGADHGVELSFFINHTAPGGGTAEHFHPYPEVFIIQSGEAEFVVDGVTVAAGSGQVVVVPTGAVHGFRNPSADVLEMGSLHPVAEMATTWV